VALSNEPLYFGVDQCGHLELFCAEIHSLDTHSALGGYLEQYGFQAKVLDLAGENF
jgi:hypothetical protein